MLDPRMPPTCDNHPVPQDFEIEFRWKEDVFYWEGARGLHFDGGWGVSPLVTYFPTAERWAEIAPGWALDRRDVILQRLIDHGDNHRVEVTGQYPGSLGVTRS